RAPRMRPAPRNGTRAETRLSIENREPRSAARADGTLPAHARVEGTLALAKESNVAHSHLLEQWTTAKGSAAGTNLTQQEGDYADLGPYQDVVVFLEVSDVSGTPNLRYETSPTKDDNLFQLMTAAAIN